MVVGAASCYFQVHLLHAYDNAPVATRAARAHAALEAKITKPPAVMGGIGRWCFHLQVEPRLVVGSDNGCVTCHRGL